MKIAMILYNIVIGNYKHMHNIVIEPLIVYYKANDIRVPFRYHLYF